MRTIQRKWRALRARPREELRHLLPAWPLLGAARALVLTMPFSQLMARFGMRLQQGYWVPLLAAPQEASARHVGRAIRTAARYTPWRSNCFAQALTAHVLLRRQGIPHTVFFGLTRSAGTQALTAHAWVCAGRVAVTGGLGFDAHTAVGCFVG